MFCSNRQMPEPRISAVAENLLLALRFFGYARTGAEIEDLSGVTLIYCGMNYAAFNAALLCQPIEADPRGLERIIEVAAKRFDARNVRWTCWICDDFLGKSLRPVADRIFHRHGLRHLTEAPGMYAEHLTAPQHPLPALEVRLVEDQRTREAFAHIMSIAFEIPQSVCTAVYGSEQAWTGELRGYVGYSDGKPLTTAAAAITNDVIGLYSVATIPECRRLGYAEAIMRQVIGQASRNNGAQRTVLQATQSGFSLYQRMGYRTVTNFSVYIAD